MRETLKLLFKGSGVYSRSLVFFVVVFALVGIFYYAFTRSPLRAEDATDWLGQGDSILLFSLSQDGVLRLGNQRVDADIATERYTYVYRYQIVNRPTEFIDELIIHITLPQAVSEQVIGHAFRNNGGAAISESRLLNANTVEYRAFDIGREAQLTIELEIPKTFIQPSVLWNIREQAAAIPIIYWVGIGVGLPILSLLILFLVILRRHSTVSPLPLAVQEPPSRLSPALLGILIRGRVTAREIAATMIDLARRGHIVIRQLEDGDFRYTRRAGRDALLDFEQALLDQLFGPIGQQATNEEINFAVAREVFSSRISQAFLLAYQRMGNLGYFAISPLKTHRRYQLTSIALASLGLLGFFATLFLFSQVNYLLFFWGGMVVSAVLISYFAGGIPLRTALGERELAKWLSYRQTMVSPVAANYLAVSQNKYLTNLPYAIVLEAEVEWTNRFIDLPFTNPSWYITGHSGTLDVFVNQIFPMIGYIARTLTFSAAPANR